MKRVKKVLGVLSFVALLSVSVPAQMAPDGGPCGGGCAGGGGGGAAGKA